MDQVPRVAVPPQRLADEKTRRQIEEALELEKFRRSHIDVRWGQLHALEKEWSEKAVQYLFLTNAGGAAATLAFLGASQNAFKSAGLQISLALFIFGLILVGLEIANIYYHMLGLYKSYKRDVGKYFAEQISWDYLTQEDENRSNRIPSSEFLCWSAFGAFIVGCIVGGFSLFG